jgi:hypothetical protein
MQYVPKMLVNFRVQLGEQMQIHELTRPRRVNEVLGAVGAALGGIAKQVGTQAINKTLGTDVTSQAGPAQNREQGFASMVNSPAAKTLATSMQAAWAETVKNFLGNATDSMGNPATSLKGVTQPSVASLEPELRALVNKMIGGSNRTSFDYSTMSNNIEDPVTKAGVREVISRINEHIQAIYKATVEGADPKSLANSWIKLVGDGVLPAQNAMAYDAGTTAGGVSTGGVRRLSPQAQRLASAAGISGDKLATLQQAIKNSGLAANDPAILDLLALPKAAE